MSTPTALCLFLRLLHFSYCSLTVLVSSYFFSLPLFPSASLIALLSWCLFSFNFKWTIPIFLLHSFVSLPLFFCSSLFLFLFWPILYVAPMLHLTFLPFTAPSLHFSAPSPLQLTISTTGPTPCQAGSPTEYAHGPVSSSPHSLPWPHSHLPYWDLETPKMRTSGSYWTNQIQQQNILCIRTVLHVKILTEAGTTAAHKVLV